MVKNPPSFTKRIIMDPSVCDSLDCERPGRKVKRNEEMFTIRNKYYCDDCAVKMVDQRKARWKEFNTPSNLFKKYGKKAIIEGGYGVSVKVD